MRRGSASAAVLLAALAGGALLAAPAARADFQPIELQSVGTLEQFEEAGEPAISADGRYLAFQGSVGGVEGIWRRELASGKLELVTGGSTAGAAQRAIREASAPSISEEGRYVSFTSSEALVKGAKPGSNVYVRDMTIDPTYEGPCTPAQEAEAECPYELASALNGSSEGLTYGVGGGAVASGRVSLSANGREVAFVIRGTSDLTSADPNELTTPELQVLVRYLNEDRTVLVSAELEAGSGQMSERPVAGGAVTPSAQMGSGGATQLPGAAISGDGSTVAWLGANIPAQAPTLSGERQQIEHDDTTAEFHYDEPLWRRIEDGPTAPTRRMVGGGDPLAPGCPPGATIEVPACQGPYPQLPSESKWEGEESHRGWLGITKSDGTPQLSYDGWSAALVGDPEGPSNVFVVDMAEGLDRVQALRRLTRALPVANVQVPGSDPQYVPGAGEVYEAGISSDGSRIAFTTQRQQFPLVPPNYTETPPAQLGVVELYEIDLADESLVRVTHGPDGGASLEGSPVIVMDRGAAAPSFSENDLTLAFADTASNLVFGDANGASDVYTVLEEPVSDVAGPVEIGPGPPSEEPERPRWTLSVVPVRQPDGSVTLDVTVPGAGELSASANAIVPVTVKAATHAGKAAARAKRKQRAKRNGHAARAGAKRHAKSKKRAKPATRVELEHRTVGSAKMPASLPGVLELPLRVASAYTKLLSGKAGIYATVKVAFSGSGGPALTQRVTISLRDTQRKSTKEEGGKR